MKHSLCLVLVIVVSCVSVIRCETVKDSYLVALDNSHGDRTSKDHLANDDSYGDYGQPFPQPGGLGYDYNPPSHHRPYGPPRPMYGPPHHYGPPMHPVEAPRKNWLLDKFLFKLDLLTIGKIVLKIILFKKVVKFFAILCMLFLLPKLKGNQAEEEPDSDEAEGGGYRSLEPKAELNRQLDEISKFVGTAIEAFTERNPKCGKKQKKAGMTVCRFHRMFSVIDQQYPYTRLFEMYAVAPVEVAASNGKHLDNEIESKSQDPKIRLTDNI